MSDAKTIEEKLKKAGWRGAFDWASDGVTIEGAGEVALQYPNKAKETLLRLEYHLEGPDGVSEIHFHVADASDNGPDFVLRPDGNLDEVLATIVALQDEITVDNVNDGMLARILDVCPATFFVYEGRLRTIRPSPEVTRRFKEGIALGNGGKFAKAAEVLADVLAQCPDHDQAASALAQVARELGDFPRMLGAAKTWSELVPDDANAWTHRSIALQNLKRFDEALDAIDEAIAIDEEDGSSHYQRACVLALAGRVKESLDAIERAVGCDPDLKDEIGEDADFTSLRSDGRFRALVG